MTDRSRFSDEELTAYLDEEADHALSEEIKRVASDNMALQKRLEMLWIDKAEIKRANDMLRAQEPALPPCAASQQSAPSLMRSLLPLRSVAASALICFVLGWSTALHFHNENETWQEDAAAYHALYVKKTLSGVKQSEIEAIKGLERAASAIGKETIDRSILMLNDKLEFKRAQILGFEGQPLIQLAFLSDTGVPIALCIIRSTGIGSNALHTATMRDMSSASWSNNDFEYLLIGGTDSELIEHSAHRFQEHFQSADAGTM